jgi:hypothetical protein
LGFVGFTDLNRASQIIVSRTYYALIPYFAIAIIYLVMVIFFTHLVGKLEKRLRVSDAHARGGGKKIGLRVTAEPMRGPTAVIVEVDDEKR